MGFISEKIGIIVTDRLNRNLLLPDIQREFVWKPDKITKLFDSIMRGYPISSFLFWKVGQEIKSQMDTYAFFQDYKEGQVHTSTISTSGIPELTLVLDGQQRFTSLLIGLKGTYTTKKKHKRRTSADAWETKRLFINLLRNPDLPIEDGELGLRYEFDFRQQTPELGPGEYWLPVGAMLDYAEFSAFSKFKYAERKKLPAEIAGDMDQLEIFETNLDRLYHAIWTDQAIPYHVENEQDSDRVLDIFVRTNDGGVQLSKSDLLLSMITANWNKVSAKAAIQGVVELINNDLPKRNDFNKDFVLKACLALCDFNVRYKVENFNSANMKTIESNWSDIRDSIIAGVKLINAFGIDRDTLTSANAVIPVIYYLYKSRQFQSIDVLIGGTGSDEANNRRAIRRWIILALLGKVFGGHSDDVLTRARTVVKNHLDSGNHDFPADKVNSAIGLAFDAEDFLDIRYGDRVDFLAVSLLYDQDDWGLVPHHKDHIFPRARFGWVGMADIPSASKPEFQEQKNSIANLQLLVADENAGKSDKDFETWLQSRGPAYRTKHLIPSDDQILVFGRFPEFIEAREELIRERLHSLGIE